MKLSARDRRALLLLGCAVIGILLYVAITDAPEQTATAVSLEQAISAAEKRVERMRQLAAQLPARTQVYQKVMEQLAQREKRMLTADTAAQAQAQLLTILRRIASAQSPRIEIRNSEFGPVKAFGEHYGEIPVSITMECGIEQLLNLVAELTSQPELVALQELRVYSANQKQKTTNVRLTVSAVVAKKLVPERKGVAF
ncbi:MAG: type II secretion system protein GspM [Bryobacteraceae bacterium]|nr:type II secretion system protein GspM [Bryobacteraceae bacterium]MDW8378903.1 type II secretion system protein GspM [Bryobacterales bacterium]